MSMPASDWDTLSAEWRGCATGANSLADDAAARLRQRVRRATRRQRVVLALEIALSLGAAWYAWFAYSEPGGGGKSTAFFTVFITLVVWSFALWNRRGSWRPLGESTSDFLRVCRARTIEARRAIVFVRITLLIAVAVYTPPFVSRLSRGAIDGVQWWRWGVFPLYVAAFYAWTLWERRRVLREGNALDELESALAD